MEVDKESQSSPAWPRITSTSANSSLSAPVTPTSPSPYFKPSSTAPAASKMSSGLLLSLPLRSSPTSPPSSSSSSTTRRPPGASIPKPEFVLLVQKLIDRVFDSLRKKSDDSDDVRAELIDGKELRDDASSGGNELVRVLERVLELGVSRSRLESLPETEISNVEIEEGEMMLLRRIVWENSDIFDALCWNVWRQVRGLEREDASGMAVRRDDVMPKEEDVKVLRMLQRNVQLAHLDACRGDRVSVWNIASAN